MASRFDDEDSEDEDAGLGEVGLAGTERKDKNNERKPRAAPSFPRLGSIEEALGAAQDGSDGEDDYFGETDGRGPAPFMSQMLEAQAQLNPAEFGAAAIRNEGDMFGQQLDTAERTSLAQRLKDIFDLPQLEDVISGALKDHPASLAGTDNHRISMLAA